MKHETDRQLAEELTDYRQSQGLTNHVLGQRLGVSATFISEYLNDRLQRDPKDFSERARNILRALRARLEDATNLFETSVSKNIAGRIDMARRTQDVMLIVGPSGEGKTCGAKLYVARNPGTIYFELASHQRTGNQVMSLLFSKLERRNDWKGNTSRADFVTQQLRGSSRAIICDEAHLLEASGRQTLFCLTRDTGCAVVLVGNPEILDKIRRNEQHFSRIGVKGEPLLSGKEIPAVSLQIATQFSTAEFADEVADLVAFVATKPGRMRAVRKNIILAYEIHQKTGSDARKSFRDAHRNLVRDYALPADC